jgi:hypothetical protein
MSDKIKVEDTGGGRFIVGGKLVVSTRGGNAGIYRVAEEGVPGKKLANGDIGHAKRLIVNGKV